MTQQEFDRIRDFLCANEAEYDHIEQIYLALQHLRLDLLAMLRQELMVQKEAP